MLYLTKYARIMKKYIQPNTNIAFVKGSMNLCMVSGETDKVGFKSGEAESNVTAF